MPALPGQRKVAFTIKNLIVKEVRKQLKKPRKGPDGISRNKIASGRTYKSVRGRVISLFSVTKILILSDESLKFIISGRRKGAKQPPPEVILDWIKVRRIQGRDRKTGRFIKRSVLAFLIGRAISERGIEPTPILEEALKPINTKIIRLITIAGREGIRNEIVRQAKAII